MVDNALLLWSNPIYDKDLYAALYFEGVIIFTEVKKYLLDDILPHHHHLMEQLVFDEGHPHPLAGT